MDLELLKNEILRFGQENLDSIAEKIDKENYYPREIIRELGSLGFLVPNLSSLDPKVLYEVEKWVSYFSGSVGLLIDVQAALVSEPIRRFANESVKKEILEPLAKGEIIGAFALSEPCCGTDTYSIQTRAVKKDGGYQIKGKKMWSTQGLYADVFLVAAKDEEGKLKAYLVRKDNSVEVQGIEVMGVRGTGTSEITFNDTWTEREMEIGGWEVIRHGLTVGRLAIAGISVGLALAAFDEAWKWSADRVAFGSKIRDHQAVMWQIVDSSTEIVSADLLSSKAAEKFFEPEGEYLVPMAKLYASTVANRVADRSLQVMGGMGYAKGSKVERIYRDARLMRIGEGTDEAERMIIGKRLEKIGVIL